MTEQIKNPKRNYAKNTFITIVYLAWCGVVVNAFFLINSAEAIPGYLQLLIILPSLALPGSFYALNQKEKGIKKQYEEYLTEIKTIVDSVIDSGYANQIKEPERKKIIQWAERLDHSTCVQTPGIIKEYLDYSGLGIFLGIICGASVMQIVEKILEVLNR